MGDGERKGRTAALRGVGRGEETSPPPPARRCRSAGEETPLVTPSLPREETPPLRTGATADVWRCSSPAGSIASGFVGDNASAAAT